MSTSYGLHGAHGDLVSEAEGEEGLHISPPLPSSTIIPPTCTSGASGSVLWAEPSVDTLTAVAKANCGGGSGGGDAVTRAQAIQLRHTVCRSKVALKLPHERPSFQAKSMKGHRVPSSLDTQYAVNGMLMQEANKMSVVSLRAAIAKQQEDAEKQQAELEQAQTSGLSIDQLLTHALAKRLGEIRAYLQDNDTQGDGRIYKEDFVAAMHVLRVHHATTKDMGVLFDTMDFNNDGYIDHATLLRIAKRRASTVGLSKSSHFSIEPAELDLSLQGTERSRQLKEMLFTRETIAAEDYAKQKEVKSFVATGEPLILGPVQHATVAAREAHVVQTARLERAVARARLAAMCSGDRVMLAESVAAMVGDALPTFGPYLNDTWGKREAVLARFHLGIRIQTQRSRVDRRIKALRTSLHKAGVLMSDAASVKQLVLSLSRSGGGSPSASASGDSAVGCEPQACELQRSDIAPFSFPGPPEEGEGGARGDPIMVTPIGTFDHTRLFALRVPRRHMQMNYGASSLAAPGAFAPMEQARELRIGAAFESGRPLPSGPTTPVPCTWAMPTQMLIPLPPSPLGVGLGATRTLGREAAGGSLGAGGVVRRLMSAPPTHVETDARQLLRPTAVVTNDFWQFEAVGGCSLTLLRAPAVSSCCLPVFNPWFDALTPLPDRMNGIELADVAEELSEDESDTEVDFQPPTQVLLVTTFDIPGKRTEAERLSVVGEAASRTETAEPASRAALGLEDEGDAAGAAVAALHALPVDASSEYAGAQTVLSNDLAGKRRERRLRMRIAFGALNELIEQPRHRLSVS